MEMRGRVEQRGDFEPQSTSAVPHDEIKRLLQADQKINAIKLYRQATGASLREAKDAVESLEREVRGRVEQRGDVEPQSTSAVPHDEIKRLLQADQKISAIKLYRQATGASLREAKDAVESLEREVRENKSGPAI